MEYQDFFILQFIAHLLADYFFQNDQKAKEKNQSGFKSKFLKWHVLVVFMTAWLLSFQFWFFTGALVLTFTHWLSDGIKPEISKIRILSKYSFFIDQLIHILLLIIVTAIYYQIAEIKTVINLNLSTYHLLIIASYVFCAKPANIFIREILIVFNIQITKDRNEV